MKNDESCTCVGCGKDITSGKDGEEAVEVRVGKILDSQIVDGRRVRGRPRTADDRFLHDHTWGLLHLNCFLRAVEVPDLVFTGAGG